MELASNEETQQPEQTTHGRDVLAKEHTSWGGGGVGGLVNPDCL